MSITIANYCEKLPIKRVEAARILDYSINEPVDVLYMVEELNNALFGSNPLEKFS